MRNTSGTVGRWFGSILLAGSLLLAGGARAEDLQAVYELALNRDAVYQAAQAQYLAAREATPQARSFLLPQINAFAKGEHDAQSITNDDRFPDQNIDTNRYGYGVTLNQVLFNRDLFLGLNQAEKSVLRAEALLEDARQALIVRVARAYFDVLAAEDTLKAVSAAKEAFKRQMDQAQKRFEVGLIAITDYKEAQAAYDSATASEIAARNDLEVARSALEAIVGQKLGAPAKLTDRFQPLRPDPDDVEEWIRRAKEQNVQIIAAQHATDTALIEVKRQRAGHWPTVGLSAGAVQDNTSSGLFGGRDIGTLSVGVRLDLPIYSGGFVSSRVREASHNFQASQEQLIQVRRDVIKQTSDAYLTVLSNISRLHALKRAVESNQASYEATQAGFEVGTRTSVDVSQAIRNLFAAERDYKVARYEYIIATLSLKRAAGMLSAEDIQRINAWLD